MPLPVNLTLGDHELQKPVVAWMARIVTGDPETVKLIASLQSSPRGPSLPSQGQTATSLAFQMDRQVAMSLYQELGELADSMGWQRPR